jgi:hypothetical protein
MIGHPDKLTDALNKLLWGTIRRRFLAAALMGGLTLVAPWVAANAPGPHNELRMPILDLRAIESLQRWASEEDEREFDCAGWNLVQRSFDSPWTFSMSHFKQRKSRQRAESRRSARASLIV